MKVTFYQRKYGKPFTSSEKSKIAKERSDFLIFPERALLPTQCKVEVGLQLYEKEMDHLLDLSDSYKGVVLGGSLFRYDSRKKKVESVPLIQDFSLIDHYDIIHPSVEGLEPGDSENIFIMAGVRFTILAGNDIYDRNMLQTIQNKGIDIIFYLDGIRQTRTYEEDLEFFSTLSKERNWNIFRVCGHDVENGYSGRSLVSTPSGIQWKVGMIEEGQDILKTIHFAQSNPFL